MIALGGTNIVKAYLGSTELANIAIGDELLLSSEPEVVIMTSETNAAAMAVCYAQGWAAHADYMTQKEAAAVTSIGSVFYGNTSLVSFDEFQYFTGISGLDTNAFRGTQLSSIILPNSLIHMDGSYLFYQCTNLSNLEVPEGVVSIDGIYWIYQSHIVRLTLPSTLTTANRALMTNAANNNYKCTVICKAVTPPTLSGDPAYAASIDTVYVPDGSVDTYKSAANWVSISSKIKSINEL